MQLKSSSLLIYSGKLYCAFWRLCVCLSTIRYAYICSENFVVDVVISQFRWSDIDKLELPLICWLVLCFIYVCQQFYEFLVFQEKFFIFSEKKASQWQLTHACRCVCSSQQAAVVYLDKPGKHVPVACTSQTQTSP